VHRLSVEATTRVCRRRVGDEPGLEAEVAGHAGRGRAAVVGGEAGDHDRLGAGVAQAPFEAGSDEGAVDELLDDGLARERRRLGLELERLGAAAEEALRRSALVPDVDDRGVRFAPGREQVGDPRLGVRVMKAAGGIVALAGAAVTGTDALDAIDNALAAVEATGVEPSGIASKLTILSVLRKEQRAQGAMPAETSPDRVLFGLPVATVSVWPGTVAADAIVGAARDPCLDELSLEEMDRLWDEAKAAERS